ncbi:hypothetical protein D6C90_04491, partial [Aureobasidium pullulans]
SQGDGVLPICRRCAQRQEQCDRPEVKSKFVVYTPNSSLSRSRPPEMHRPNSVERPQRSAVQATSNVEHNDLRVPDPINPRADLGNQVVAGLLHHYIEHLAAWYDLCEHDRPFELLVPIRALDLPVLFNAIIAFSAQHMTLSDSRYEVISTVYHSACIHGLLSGLSDFDPGLQEDYLVAACLLRSFEILKADSREEQRHLLGAYRFSSTEEIDMTSAGLLQAGAWNYLREEITVALECRRPVRLTINLDIRTVGPQPESMHANTVTYILARVINYCFNRGSTNQQEDSNHDEWTSLKGDLTYWKESLPTSYEPYSRASKEGNVFPSAWYLRPWHIAAAEYYLTAQTLLLLHNSDTVLDVKNVEGLCGIAYTNESKAARVNAFGPMAFCGRYLTDPKQREGLKQLLLTSSLEVGWPVHRILEDLETFWHR